MDNNIVEDFTIIHTIITPGVNSYTDDSDQTTDFTFGNKIEYYIEAIYYDRENNYLYPTLTSNTDYGV